jgi:hypothetical protein
MRLTRFGPKLRRLVVYPKSADNCLASKIDYNAPITLLCQGAWP